jgi:cytochrome d ubiquinol oxidase subunit I
VVEIGRQPYVVYGLLRTSDAVSPAISAAAVLSSLVVFALVYAVVFGSGIWYLWQMVRKGPLPHEPPPETDEGEKTPARPLSVGNKSPDTTITEARS